MKRQSIRVRLLLSGFGASALALLTANVARAQDASGLETVVVTGASYALQKSIDEKRDANVVSDGIAADEIGQTPEFGIGDALRRCRRDAGIAQW